MIFQVIALHHILVIMDATINKLRENAVEIWFQLTENGFKTCTILMTCNLISSLASLSVQALRRQVKKTRKK